MEWFTSWGQWHWLILGFALLIAEVIIPGIFLLWWGLAAIVVAGLAFITGLSLTLLGIIYALLSFIFSLLWWKYQHSKDEQEQAHCILNQRDNAMIGAKGSVQEIASNGIGRGHFGDTTWRIEGNNLQVGDKIQVLEVQGITLLVRKLD